MVLVCKVDGKIYQTNLSRKSRVVRAGKTKERESHDEDITYAWPENELMKLWMST